MIWFRRHKLEPVNEDLTVKLGRANALNNQHTATIRALNKAVQDYQRNLSLAQAAVERLTQERDRAWVEAADLAAEKVRLADQVRTANASLSGTREHLRQSAAAEARAEQDAAACRAELAGTVSRVRALEAELFRLRGAVQP